MMERRLSMPQGVFLNSFDCPETPVLPARPGYQAVLVTQGSGVLHVHGQEARLRRGQVLLLPPETEARWLSGQPLSMIAACISPGQWPDDAAEWQSMFTSSAFSVLSPPPEEKMAIARLFSQLQEAQRHMLPGWRTEMRGLSLCLAVRLLRLSREETAPADDALADACAWAQEHAAEDVTLEKWAAAAQLSPRHFDRLFLARFGMPPMAWLAGMRIARARMLLRETQRPVTEIAFDCGYADSNYFARVFRKATGQSPQQYRQQALLGLYQQPRGKRNA